MTIQHIILLKFKQDATFAEIDNIRASIRSLPSKIAGIVGLKVGRKIKHRYDHDYDEGFILIFKDEDALKYYEPHPAHVAHVDLAVPIVQEVLIYDIHADN